MTEIAPALLHEENFARTPVLGERMRASLESRAREVEAETAGLEDPDVSIVIRSRNNAPQLAGLFDDIQKQKFAGEVQVIVVDTESTDGSVQYSRRNGATVVPITQKGFNYSDALNKGFAAADHPWVYSLVSHSSLSNDVTLRGITRHAGADVGGMYGVSLPDRNATWTERIGAVMLGVPKLLGPAEQVSDGDALGLLASNCAAVNKESWTELGGYDERYGAGGEDGDMARRMMAAGMSVVREPALSVYHTHGLGPIAGVQQLLHWQRVAEGHDFDQEALWSYRPDLRDPQ